MNNARASLVYDLQDGSSTALDKLPCSPFWRLIRFTVSLLPKGLSQPHLHQRISTNSLYEFVMPIDFSKD